MGYPPFSESISGTPLNDQIVKGQYSFPDEFWSAVSGPAKDLIRKMMCVDPEKRLTINDVLEHSWLADDADNTTRVDKIMYPSKVISTPTSVKNAKRPTSDDNADETSPTESCVATESTKLTADTQSNGRAKRAKR